MSYSESTRRSYLFIPILIGVLIPLLLLVPLIVPESIESRNNVSLIILLVGLGIWLLACFFGYQFYSWLGHGKFPSVLFFTSLACAVIFVALAVTSMIGNL